MPIGPVMQRRYPASAITACPMRSPAAVFAPHQPEEVDIKLTDDLFIKTVVVPDAGTIIPTHSHEHAHVTLLSVGSMRVTVDGDEVGVFTASPRPVAILVKAHAMHNFTTLTPGVVYSCIHALHGTDEVAIHAYNGLNFVKD